MNHYTNPGFWTCYNALQPDVQLAADKAFTLLRENPRRPSLRFKKAGNYWSARVGKQHRALAVEANDGFVRLWVGSHAEYDRWLV